MFFKKSPPPPTGPSPEERAAIARQQQTAKLREVLDKDPCYQVTTVDGLGWICPFTGTVINAPFGWQEPALQHLLGTQPWTRTQKKSIEQLQAVRWLAWLKGQLPDEERLTILGGDGRWLNPFTGAWEKLQRPHRGMSDDLVKDIAVALSRCPQAGKLQFLSDARLDAARRPAVGEESRGHIDL